MGILKECPFCGGNDLLSDVSDTPAVDGMYDSSVHCFECDVTLRGYGKTREESWLNVMKTWNNRYVKKCENIGDKNNPLHEVDQFVCSNCGLHLEDWVEVYYDDDWGFTTEPTYYDYALEHCPHCGCEVADNDSLVHLK